MAPSYSLFIMFACVFGACSYETDPNYVADSDPKCVCKPIMKMEMSAEGSPSAVCNNATFDWVLHTMLVEVSNQKDQIQQLQDQVADLSGKVADRDTELTNSDQIKTQLEEEKRRLEEENDKLWDELRELQELKKKASLPKDCADIQLKGSRYSGIYTIYPDGITDGQGIEVFCDLNTDNGGWLVIQRRQDGSQQFDKDWETYKWGFGRIAKEFWLGNEYIHHITQQKAYELHIELMDFDGESVYAKYDYFSVEGEKGLYTLHLGDYRGTAGNAMVHHNNNPFSTLDSDNDKSRSGHCSHLYGYGGWWFVRCYDSNLNGQYFDGGIDEKTGIVWYQWKYNQESLRFVEMKIRPVDFGEPEY